MGMLREVLHNIRLKCIALDCTLVCGSAERVPRGVV